MHCSVSFIDISTPSSWDCQSFVLLHHNRYYTAEAAMSAEPLPTIAEPVAPPAIHVAVDPAQTLIPPAPPTPAPVDSLPPTDDEKPAEPSSAATASAPYIPPPHPEEVSTGKRLTPFACPLPHCVPAPRATLTPEQQKKYTDLLTTVTIQPLRPFTETLDDRERMFLTRDCLLRYLRAAKWDTSNAYSRLLSTLAWRREYAPHNLSAEHISPENETGKQWLLGYDLQGRPCLSLNPARQNTDPSDRQIQHLVFMLERAIDLMPPGQGTLTLKIDFAGASSGKTPSLSTGKQVLNILQNHYPERLGRAINLSLPWFVSAFYKLITPFVDPLTREKLVFPADKDKKKGKDGEAEITNYVPKEHLEKAVGGGCEFEYRHDVYWPALVGLCERRREEYERRWRERGARIGDSEAVLRGGEEEGEIEEVNPEPWVIQNI